MGIVIDTHTHIGLRPDLSFLAEDLVQRMDATAQDKALAFPMIVNFEPYPPRFNPFSGNDYIAAAQRAYPDRIIGLAAVTPWLQAPMSLDWEAISAVPSVEELLGHSGFERWSVASMREMESTNVAVMEIERAILELGLHGLKFHSVLQGTAMNNPVVMPRIMETLVRCGEEAGRSLVVVMHCMADSPLNTPEQMGWLAERYPELIFIMAHMGTIWNLPSAIEVAELHSNVFLDLTWAPNTRATRLALERVGPERITAGSDEPFGTFEAKEAMVRLVSDVPDVLSLIRGGNVARVLGVS